MIRLITLALALIFLKFMWAVMSPQGVSFYDFCFFPTLQVGFFVGLIWFPPIK